MKLLSPHVNLVIAWLWIFLGFLSGMVLGLFFHRENWLGGYGSLQRRMYRLGHISFFGLGAVNLLFWLTMESLPVLSPHVSVASWTFVIGAITMPLCCAIMAHFPKWHLIFTVPVVSLLVAGALTAGLVIRSETLLAPDVAPISAPSNHQHSTLHQP
jgi:hypothetical protein